MENSIEVTGVDLVELVKAVYDNSRPQGLGLMHYQPGGLTDEQAKSLIGYDGKIPVSLDYVSGRACKFVVFRDGEQLFIRDQWFDHSQDQLRKMLTSLGLDASKVPD